MRIDEACSFVKKYTHSKSYATSKEVAHEVYNPADKPLNDESVDDKHLVIVPDVLESSEFERWTGPIDLHEIMGLEMLRESKHRKKDDRYEYTMDQDV